MSKLSVVRKPMNNDFYQARRALFNFLKQNEGDAESRNEALETFDRFVKEIGDKMFISIKAITQFVKYARKVRVFRFCIQSKINVIF